MRWRSFSMSPAEPVPEHLERPGAPRPSGGRREESGGEETSTLASGGNLEPARQGDEGGRGERPRGAGGGSAGGAAQPILALAADAAPQPLPSWGARPCDSTATADCAP